MIAARRGARPPARGALAGLLATVAMDLGARTVIAPALGVEPPRPDGLGRWIGHMRHGQFVHANIATAPHAPHEAAIGIATHYAIGATLGSGYEFVRRAGDARRASLPHALAYGTASTVFSWFLMFPATGLGALGRRGGPRLAALSLCNHVVYGLALGVATRRLAPAPRTPRRSTADRGFP